MNEAAREVETRNPGTRHHEAAHAVFAYHSRQPIPHVMVGEDSESLSYGGYERGDLESTSRFVAGILAGKYAQELAATGKPRQHVPYEEFAKLDFSHFRVERVGYARHPSVERGERFAYPTCHDDTGFGSFRATVL